MRSMSLAFFVGLRYLFSRSRMGAVGWVSAISVLALSVVSAALVVVLSVYNGYVDIILQGSKELNADLVIRPTQGRTLNLKADTALRTALDTEGIEAVTGELRSLGILQRDGAQSALPVVGIGADYSRVLNLTAHLSSGTLVGDADSEDDVPMTLGIAVAVTNGYLQSGEGTDAQLYFPKREGFINPLAPASAFVSAPIQVAGVLTPLREDVDKQAYVSITQLQTMLGYPEGACTSVLLKLKQGTSLREIKSEISNQLGQAYQVLDREEQQPELAYLIRTERWMIYLIMGFILLLAGFSLASSLVMMIMEKEQDLSTLHALGLSVSGRASIFVTAGVFISLLGSLTGLLLGLLLSLSQEYWGWVTVGQGLMSMPLPSYLKATDLVWVLLMTLSICGIVAWLPNLFMIARAKQRNK